ncbi:MAG: alpha/beta hydrolase [Chitinophagaceae bacterium]
MRSIMLIVSFCLLLSCKKNETTVAAQTTLNVHYGTDSRQVMDVYLPANRTASSTPVLILIHGGGWSSGDKSDFTQFVDTLKRRIPNYAVFNITYRLAGSGANLFPAQEQDVKQCIEFIYNNRNKYRISDRFALMGASAGGHLSLLQAYKYTSPVKIKAVVDLFGPTELTQLYNNPPGILIPLLLLNVTGAIPTSNPVIYQQSSPLNYVVAGSTPTLIIQGGMDDVVPAWQSTLLRDKLQSVSVPNEFVLYPSGGHGNWDQPTYADAFLKMEQFLKTYNP